MIGLERTIDLVSLSQALIVVDQASFSGAAKILGVRQSAVSRRIRALEDELGVSLFERQSNGVRPTIAGRRFFERARAVFTELDNAAQAAMAAGRGVEGVIRIGILPCMTSGYLGELLGHYREFHPDVAMEFFEGVAREQVGKIRERSLDVAFVVDGTAAYGCDVERFWTAGVAVALPDRHPLAGCEVIEWEFLKDEHFIFGREAIGSGLVGIASDRVAKLDGRLSLEAHDISQDAVMKLVALKFGLGIVGEGTTSVHYPDIMFRPLPLEQARIDYSAIWLPGNDNPALRRFLSLARSKSAVRRQASKNSK
ncbi:MAG: LysR family transcriptional regulator [Methylocystaceae bacterium]|nr:MAG: LysR family transcriptional regulator [Methylocystaceae bacterium]